MKIDILLVVARVVCLDSRHRESVVHEKPERLAARVRTLVQHCACRDFDHSCLELFEPLPKRAKHSKVASLRVTMKVIDRHDPEFAEDSIQSNDRYGDLLRSNIRKPLLPCEFEEGAAAEIGRIEQPVARRVRDRRFDHPVVL